MMAVQFSFQSYNELYPVDLTPEVNRNEEDGYIDYFKKAIKLALSQVYCNGGTYLQDEAENLSETPLNSLPDKPTSETPEMAEEALDAVVVPEPKPMVVDRPIIKTLDSQIRAAQRPRYEPQTFQQKALMNSYIQRQKLLISDEPVDLVSAIH